MVDILIVQIFLYLNYTLLMPPNPDRRVTRCIARTKLGARCKRRTARTNLCFAHLDSTLHLKIKPSGIRDAGLGLYTTKRRHIREVVAPYSGQKIVTNDPEYRGEYVLQTKRTPPPPYKYVDARLTTSGAGRFSNMARRGNHRKNNAKLGMSVRYGTANVIAKRVIPAGGEVLTSYGDDYWH